MTSVRFVGELPLWLGLLLALAGSISCLALLSSRKTRPHGLVAWVLPLLRSIAIVLVVIVLSGPVLHHRNVVGVLGRVLIYLDGSQSMGATDGHMSAARKVLVAQQLGWLPSTQVDTRVWKLAEEVASIRQDTVHMLQVEPVSEIVVEQCRSSFVKRLESVDREWRELDANRRFDNGPPKSDASPADQDSDEAPGESSSGDARDQLVRDVLARATAITFSPAESPASEPSSVVADSADPGAVVRRSCDLRVVLAPCL